MNKAVGTTFESEPRNDGQEQVFKDKIDPFCTKAARKVNLCKITKLKP